MRFRCLFQEYQLSLLLQKIVFKFDVPATTKGVVVTKSSGEAETFKEGVVIVEINGEQINTVQDVGEKLKRGSNRFYVWYKNKYRFLNYRVP